MNPISHKRDSKTLFPLSPTPSKVSAMCCGCGLNSWGSNSFIVHAVPQTPGNITGPYVQVDTALGVWSHNTAPLRVGE